MEFLAGIAVTLFMVLVGLIVISFLYVVNHIETERKTGKSIPLPWEKPNRKPFDKSDIEYRDGDNT